MGGPLPAFDRASRLPRWKEPIESAWDEGSIRLSSYRAEARDEAAATAM